MFFKRKIRNRRLKRGAVLDVKLRSDKVRAARTRAIAVSLGVVFGTIFCIYLLWRTGQWTMNELVYQNPAFSLTQVNVTTDGVIAPEQIRRWARVKTGQNIMALDLARVKRDLELIPLIENVAVERVLPHGLRISVIEREPVAQVSLPRVRPEGGIEMIVLHLDGDGYAMPPLDPRLRASPSTQPEPSLPVLTGVNPTELVPGRRVDSKQVLAALELVTKFAESPMAALVDLKRVDVALPEVLVATTDQGSEITFSLAGLDQQLLRWHEIYQEGMRYNKAIYTLDLSVSNNIPARWLEANVFPTTPRRTAKPTRTRKNNV